MGSRLRENPDRLFEVFAEVGRPTEKGKDPFVLQQYPTTYKEEDVLKSLPKFVFPCVAESPAVDHFTFVLTDIDSKFKFGFCRHAAGGHTCLCIISCYPWFEVFYKLLNNIAEQLNSTEVSVDPLLKSLYDQKLLSPGDLVEVTTSTPTQKFSFHCPKKGSLPTIPENRNLTEYYNAVDVNNMITLFACMLNERRILVVSKKLSRLTSCVHAAANLLTPMHWQHLFIPVLPHQLIDYCSAPMPFLIGLHSSLLEQAQGLGDAVILDADANKITTEYDDLSTFPSDIISSLRKRLKALQSDKMSANLPADGVSRAFLKALVSLIGGYRDALRFRPGEQITFDPDAFVQSRPRNMRPFLENMLQLQTFEQFINDRLDMLNAGEGFTDEFEMEANLHTDKWGTQSRYKDWTINMKKQGKKITREGKDKWVEFTSKANPAMKQAMQSVKDKSKKTFKDLKLKIEELRKEEEEIGLNRSSTVPPSTHRVQGPPRPAPPDLSKALGPIPTPRQSVFRRASYEKAMQGVRGDSIIRSHEDRSRPLPRKPRGYHTVIDGMMMSFAEITHNDRSRQYKVIAFDDASLSSHDTLRSSRRTSSDDTEVMDLNMKRVSTDLLADPEIQNVMKKSYSLEDLIAPVEEEDEDEEEDSEEDDLLDVTYREVVRSQPIHVPSSSGPVSKSATLPHLSASPYAVSSASVEMPTPPPRPSKVIREKSSAVLRDPHKREPLIKRQTVYGNAFTSDLTATSPNPTNIDFSTPPNSSISDPNLASKRITSPAMMKTKLEVKAQDTGSSSLSSLEFDPLKQTDSSSSLDESDVMSKPGSRCSVSRNNAFYKGTRPPSFRRISPTPQATDALNIHNARTAFMSTEAQTTSIHNTSLKDFDPLATGQLVVDDPNKSKPADQEENLLKEWNLNFDHRSALSGNIPRMNQQPLVNVMGRPQTGGFGAMGISGTSAAPTQHATNIRQQFSPGYINNPAVPKLGPRISNIMNQLPGDAPQTVRQSQIASQKQTLSQDPFSELLQQSAGSQPAVSRPPPRPQAPSPQNLTAKPLARGSMSTWEQFD